MTNEVYEHNKNQDIPNLFLEISQLLQNCLGALGMPGQTHWKRQYHPAENFDVYPHAKIKFIAHSFLEILQKYCILILNNLGMPGHTHQK